MTPEQLAIASGLVPADWVFTRKDSRQFQAFANAVLEQAAVFLEERWHDAYRGVQERSAIAASATWVRDLKSDLTEQQ